MNFGHSRPNSKVSTVPVTAPTAKVTAMYFDQRWASCIASASSCLRARWLAINAIAAQDTPRGTRMMWNASVKAIWARAQGTGSTAVSAGAISAAEGIVMLTLPVLGVSRRLLPRGRVAALEAAHEPAHETA